MLYLFTLYIYVPEVNESGSILNLNKKLRRSRMALVNFRRTFLEKRVFEVATSKVAQRLDF